MPLSPARRVALIVEYDGTGLHGWQAQGQHLPTVQSALEQAASQVVGHPVWVEGASRTDAGVHALAQLAAVTIEHPIPAAGLASAMNRRLPDAVAVRAAREVPLDFSPRRASVEKTYAYHLYTDHIPRPLLRRYAWRVPWPLDLELIERAARDLVGTWDFASFAAADHGRPTTTRTITRIEAVASPSARLTLRFAGPGFLKQMVRTLVGTLVEVGRGQRPPDCIPGILAARLRAAAGRTAPPHGLVLERTEVAWPEEKAVEAAGGGTGPGPPLGPAQQQIH